MQDSALFILSAARQALDATGDTGAPGAHGKVKYWQLLSKLGCSGHNSMLRHLIIVAFSSCCLCFSIEPSYVSKGLHVMPNLLLGWLHCLLRELP